MKGIRGVLLPSLRGYRGAWLAPDLLAGLTLVAIAIPEQMATAHLANMPTVTGFYAFIAGALAFALLGRHPLLSVGADSTIAPIFAAGVASVAVAGSAQYAHLVSATALVVGGILVAVAALRLGWVADFFPLPVVTGLLAGIAVQIAVKQLPTVLGLAGGGTTTIGRLRAVAHQIRGVNGWALGIAIAVLALLVVTEKVDRRIPGALIGVVGATVVAAAAGLSSHGLRVVGTVEAHLPQLGLPSVKLSLVGHLMTTAVVVAFLCVVQTSATVRETPAPRRPGGTEPGPADFEFDLAAIGAGSILAGLAGSFPVDASPPRTAVAGAAGGRSQVAGLVAAGAVAVVVAVAAGLLRDLPEAALGAILLFVASRLFRVNELVSIYRFGKTEFALSAITLAVVVLIGTEQGVVAAALLALGRRVSIAARPRDEVLGREQGTEHWVPTDIGRPTEQVPGIVVYLLYAPIWYGNAAYVVQRVERAVADAGAPVHTLVMDAMAMSDIDYTGAKAMGQLVQALQSRGTTVLIARASHLVHHDLKHGGVLGSLGGGKLFASVEEAVRAAGAPAD